MRTVQRVAALAALLPCLAMAAPAALAAPAGARPQALGQAQALARAQVAVGFTKVPKTIGENSAIEISGAAKNRTQGQLPGLTLRLRYSAQPVTGRIQLDQIAKAQPSSLPNVGPQQPLAQAAAPGAKQNWTLRTNPRQLGLRLPNGTPGVYPVGVEVLNSAQQVVGGVTTFLTLMPKQRRFKPVAVGWIVPLIDRMHRTNDRTYIDDRLSTDLAPGGRLRRIVDAAAATSTPLTWAIDPALLDDVQRMATGDYYVRAPGAKKATRKEKSAVAAEWLTALKNASKGDPYFVLPYGDPDVTALVRRKTTRDIGIAFDERNTGFVAQILGRAPDAHVAWPAGGAGGPGTLDQLAKYALKDGGTFLMNSSQFQNPANGAQPNATSVLQTHLGAKKTLIFDQAMNQIVSDGPRSATAALLSEQRFLAETAVIAGEAPNAQRTVVVAPDRHWNPAPGLAKNLLTYTKGAAWLRETPLRKIASAAPQQRVFNGYPDPFQRYELGDAHLDHTQAIAERAAAFRAVMTGPVKISYERAVLRMESVAWRSTPGRAKRARNELESELKRDMGRVRVVTTRNKRVLMGGSSGRLPVLIENTLPDQAVTVRLVVTSENTAKLRLGGLDPDEALIELRPGDRAQRWIPAQAAGNGNFKVNVELQIPESRGRAYGSGETITVTVTGYGRIALLITGGGLAVLFVGVGVRAIRARRRRKAEAAGDGPTGMGSAESGEPGDGLPGSGLSGAGVPAAELPGVSGSGAPPASPPATGPATGPAAGPPAPGDSSPGAPAAAPAGPGTPGPAPGPDVPEPPAPAGVSEPAADGQAARRGEHRGRDGD